MIFQDSHVSYLELYHHSYEWNRLTDNCQGTSSFIATCAVFDALQTAVIARTGYTKNKFAVIHPGGAVGKRLNNQNEKI